MTPRITLQVAGGPARALRSRVVERIQAAAIVEAGTGPMGGDVQNGTTRPERRRPLGSLPPSFESASWTPRTADQLAELYHTSRWMRVARDFRRLHPICARPGCGRRSEVVDHVIPRSTARTAQELHVLTWGRSNMQAL